MRIEDSTYVTITGAPATGKSTLLSLLKTRLKCAAIYEKVEGNPYVPPFYSDKARWSFQLSMFYLLDAIHTQRFLKTMLRSERLICQDYDVLTHFEVYCRYLRAEGFLSADEFETCKMAHSLVQLECALPTLTVFLYADPQVLCRRLRGRNRLNESSSFTRNDLVKISSSFDQWRASSKQRFLAIDTSRMNLCESKRDQGTVLNDIREMIGL